MLIKAEAGEMDVCSNTWLWMADDMSECSTLATAVQEQILGEVENVTLDFVHNGVVFRVIRSDGLAVRCVLAGVVCPAPKQAGYELSKTHLLEILKDCEFTILKHRECEPWYRLSHAMPVSVIMGTEDLRLRLLRGGWVRIDSEMPKKCKKKLFKSPYWELLGKLQRHALLHGNGLNADADTRCFVHPGVFYKATKTSEPDMFYATKPQKPLPYQPWSPPPEDSSSE